MKLIDRWNSEIEKIIDNALKTYNSNSVAVFDFDNTLIYGDQGINLMNYLILNLLIKGDEEWFWKEEYWFPIDKKDYRNLRIKYELAVEHKNEIAFAIELLDEFYHIFNKLEKIDLEIAYRWTKIIFAGFSIEELKRFSRISFEQAIKEAKAGFFEKELPSGNIIQTGIIINPLFKKLIQQLNELHWNIFIITASPEPAIQSIADYWNIPEDKVLGMKLKQNNNLLLPEIIEPYSYNKGKYLHLRNKVQEPIIIAAGDSYPDIYLLENAKIPIFLKRKNKEELLKLAKEKNFYIQEVEE